MHATGYEYMHAMQLDIHNIYGSIKEFHKELHLLCVHVCMYTCTLYR